MHIGTESPSPATLLFNRPIWHLLPQMNQEPINIKADNGHCEAQKAHQDKYLRGSDTLKGSLYFPIRSTVPVYWEDRRPWTHKVIKETNSTDNNTQPTSSE